MLKLFVAAITILTALLPYIISRIRAAVPGIQTQKSYDWLPLVAAILFLVAWFLPDVHISRETTTFQQHFVGGGMYSAALFVYFKKLFGWKFSLFGSLVVLFAFVSALGVANELMEFTATKLHLAHIGTGDTDWDLLANTLGAFVGYAILLLAKIEKQKTSID